MGQVNLLDYKMFGNTQFDLELLAPETAEDKGRCVPFLQKF